MAAPETTVTRNAAPTTCATLSSCQVASREQSSGRAACTLLPCRRGPHPRRQQWRRPCSSSSAWAWTCRGRTRPRPQLGRCAMPSAATICRACAGCSRPRAGGCWCMSGWAYRPRRYTRPGGGQGDPALWRGHGRGGAGRHAGAERAGRRRQDLRGQRGGRGGGRAVARLSQAQRQHGEVVRAARGEEPAARWARTPEAQQSTIRRPDGRSPKLVDGSGAGRPA